MLNKAAGNRNLNAYNKREKRILHCALYVIPSRYDSVHIHTDEMNEKNVP